MGLLQGRRDDSGRAGIHDEAGDALRALEVTRAVAGAAHAAARGECTRDGGRTPPSRVFGCMRNFFDLT
ncbi:hypothetical protein FKO59_10795 [Burkholderia pseudomallei]|uniref:Uncharacterized protein n=1 Tax=Burkholderia mallei TaxID=13373 RepID=A0AAX1ZSN4_BURML|nr:hypothetical protein EXY28_36185 [Burkholderia pseudomallei]RUN03875.1 hypothetical protein EGT61_031275 [Burkholderia mallei]QBI51520.1 hypothetical protein EXY72_36175 [Burkholderia pseudomallei]QBP53276.1 hypothetical protein E2R28_35995 [Burkholderia pseudomallei]QBR28722.1 hypothetical protein E3O37_36330 [Burkholderia pseudomallei]